MRRQAGADLNRLLTAELDSKRVALVALCRKYGVARLDVFGSAATEEWRPGESDLARLHRRVQARLGPWPRRPISGACRRSGGPLRASRGSAHRGGDPQPVTFAVTWTLRGHRCMPSDPKKLLYDIAAASAAIREFCHGQAPEDQPGLRPKAPKTGRERDDPIGAREKSGRVIALSAFGVDR